MSGNVVSYIDEELKKDKDIITAAVNQNSYCVKFL